MIEGRFLSKILGEVKVEEEGKEARFLTSFSV